ADAVRLYASIARAAFPGAATLRGYLERQECGAKLALGLSPGDRFANKTGETSRHSHDGGILQTADGRTYAVVVYTESPAGRESDARLGAFMRALRAQLEATSA
ncbi:MAG: serine hydrolase, partial [Candidatus Eremiobacteraeota bacterium]|nr:serine hydrolase [Candidatus Eremiobacteraeota bacterium]